MPYMVKWVITVIEIDEEYVYRFDTWSEALAKLATFDGYALDYIITREKS